MESTIPHHVTAGTDHLVSIRPAAPVQPVTAPPRSLAHEAASIGRCGRYSCHLHGGNLHLYELVPGARTGEPGSLCRHLSAVHHLPRVYLDLHDVRRAIEEARECLRGRQSLTVAIPRTAAAAEALA